MAETLGVALAAALAGGAVLAIGAPGWIAVATSALGGAAAARLLGRRVQTKAAPRTAPSDPDQTDRLPRGAGGALLEALPVGVILINESRAIRFANEAASEMFGLRETADPHVSVLRSPPLLELIDTTFQTATEGDTGLTLRRGTERHLHALARPLAMAPSIGGRAVLVAIEDVTQTRLAGDLHRDFVANASHELKTPLAAVSGIIETLLGHAREDPDATARFLGMMSDQTARMTRLVEDLLSLNRIELNERVLPRHPENVIGIVHEVVDALRPIAEAQGTRLHADLPGTPFVVFSDRDELSQLFRNLIDNAIKYGGEGGVVTVRRVPPSPDAPGMGGIEVSDQGPGIAPEHLPRLTERFYRISASGSRAKGGTGLGLAIVKHALNRHRGRLQIESVVGEGARFTVWLPMAAAQPGPAAAARTQTEPAPQSPLAHPG